MKVSEVIQLLEYIKLSNNPEDTWPYYQQYVEYSLGKISQEIGRDLPQHLKERYLEKARTLFFKYFTWQVTYPPEMSYIVPYYLGTRAPMIQWKQETKKMTALRAVAQRCGRVITCGFRLCRKIVMIDIDFTKLDSKKWIKAYEVAIRHKLPVKVTWHKGLHIYIPAKEDKYPDGLLLKIVREGSREVYMTDKLSQCVILSEDGNIRVEIMIDAVTHHPLQSWLWIELDDASGLEDISDVTFVSCTIPLVQYRDGRRDYYPYSAKWFVWGESLAREDVEELFTQVLQELAEALRLRLEGATEVKIVKAEPKLIEEAKTAPREYKFRGGGGTGDVFEIVKELLLPYEPEEVYLFRAGVTFEDFLSIAKKLDKHGVLPNCVKFFILDPSLPYKIRHWIFIVAWFLLQHMKKWTLSEVREKLAPHVADLHDLTPNLYYYLYYSCAKRDEDNPDDIVFPRPLMGIRQLAEALEHMITNEEMCRECPYWSLCSRSGFSATRKLLDVVDMIAVEIYTRKELHSLLPLLDPMVVERLIKKKVPVLPRFPYNKRMLMATVLSRA